MTEINGWIYRGTVLVGQPIPSGNTGTTLAHGLATTSHVSSAPRRRLWFGPLQATRLLPQPDRRVAAAFLISALTSLGGDPSPSSAKNSRAALSRDRNQIQMIPLSRLGVGEALRLFQLEART